MAEMNMQTLLHPPFETNPPVKINISAGITGLVLAILSAVALLFGLLGLILSGIGAAFGALAGNPLAILLPIASIIGLVADLLILVGGYRMYQENPDGKRFVIYGLALTIVDQLVSLIANAVHPYTLVFSFFGLVVFVLIIGCVYYIVVISRFKAEAPLATTGTMPPPPPPPPSQPPPVQPPSA